MRSSQIDERTSILTDSTSLNVKRACYQHVEIAPMGSSRQENLEASLYNAVACVPLKLKEMKSKNEILDNQFRNGIDVASPNSDPNAHEKTSTWETFIHLLKGNVGPGCLSLPWAVSQLGVTYGVCAIFVMAYWSSYNCWTIVKLKRHIIQERATENSVTGTPRRVKDSSIVSSFTATPTSIQLQPNRLNRSLSSATSSSNEKFQNDEPDENDVRSAISYSSQTINTNITYPEVGEWAYGSHFHSYTSFCIATQQLAICTVFFSFLGENLLAVLNAISPNKIWVSHVTVVTFCLPFIMILSFIPSLKQLAPFMGLATILLFSGFGVLAFLIAENWANRPTQESAIHFRQIPLGLCAILYSFEGICLILPVESSMKEPKQFGNVFVCTMILVTCILCCVPVLCILSFGEVTNGSVTAFLLQHSTDNEHRTEWLHVANTVVSLSVLLTYPLQLFPAIEIIGPALAKQFKFFNPSGINFSSIPNADDETDLAGFEPLPPLPEHDVVMTESLDTFNANEHIYGIVNNSDGEILAGAVEITNHSGDLLLDENLKGNEPYDDTSEGLSTDSSAIAPTVMLGDSRRLRAFLVTATYATAMLIPNVQALISLAGALAGSSVALLIPPVLELKYIQSLEDNHSTTARNNRINCSTRDSWSPLWHSKAKCYILFLLGLVFCMVGTVASIVDIITIYLHPNQ